MTLTTPPLSTVPAPAVSNADAPPTSAHVITTDARALAVATAVARLVAHGVAARDEERTPPFDQLEVLSSSGLLGLTVPRVHGGADVSATTLLEAFRILAAADPNVAQIPQSHVVFLHVLRRHGTPEQRRYFFTQALAGQRFAGIPADLDAPAAADAPPRLVRHGEGFALWGSTGYTAGVLAAHWIAVPAHDADDRPVIVAVPADAPGVTVLDDRKAMGQRTTAGGTVHLDDVRVPAEHVVAYHRGIGTPQLHGALAQALHAAIDTGIADAALADAIDQARETRPNVAEDVLTARRVGELTVAVRSAAAVLSEAGRSLDSARIALAGNPRDGDAAAGASLAVATARVVAAEAALATSNGLFEVGGAASAAESAGLHRHWRNARTHTLHGPPATRALHDLGHRTLTP